jgi:hypothetical protein
MSRLPEVKAAKALMTEAMDWSVLKWLWEKSKVRQTADDANAALDRLNRKVKAAWPEEFKAAYRQLSARKNHTPPGQSGVASAELLQLVTHVKDLDTQAHSARLDAEKTFDEAERQLNTALAREGCKKAIRSWELHEKAIRAAEALLDSHCGNSRPA